MRSYVGTTECRMRYLREQLDDPAATDCGRCDNCGGLTLGHALPAEVLASARTALARPGVPIEPRRIWPTAMPALGIDVRGKIAAGELAETGRAVARYSGLGHGPRVREVIAAAPAEVPEDLVRVAVAVLADWDWAERPQGIVTIGSQTRPGLATSLGRRLGELGRLPLLGEVAHHGPVRTARSNSAHRLQTLWDGFAPPPVPLAGQPILLVDDYIDTGWTLALVARLLRRAGAGPVYPLVLGIAG
jgi:ATP-dependent DNA helicase RecQ